MTKHFTVTAILVTKDTPKKVLLGFHRKLGAWLPPGGHIELDETPIEAVIRETREEAGLDISSYLPINTLDERVTSSPTPAYFFEETIPRYGKDPEHIHLDFVYVINGFPETVLTVQTDEMKDMHWFTKEQIFDDPENFPTYPNLREKILRDIFA